MLGRVVCLVSASFLLEQRPAELGRAVLGAAAEKSESQLLPSGLGFSQEREAER